MDVVVEQEVEVLARSRFSLFALFAVLAVAGPAHTRVSEVTPTVECDGARAASGDAGVEESCSSVQIGLSASPNPVAPGGTVSFSASSYPATDCWDNLDHSWWGNHSFSMPVSGPFTWTVYCMGNGIESGSLNIAVSDPGGGGGSTGGGGGTGGAVPAVVNLPSVSGLPETGQTLTAHPGSWTNDPTGYTYVWRRSGDLLELGRGSSLALSSSHVGSRIRVDVLACNGTGCGSWASSGWTETVAEPLPEYDSAYAEGTDADEFFYTTLCGGKECPSAYFLNTASANALCARVGGYITRSNPVTKLWRMRHELSFCADRNRVTRVWDRIIDAEILTPWWSRSIYPWKWTTVTDSPPTLGVWSSRSFARVRFEMCAVFRNFGPLCQTAEPWIEIVIRGDGSAVCNSSTGRICALRR